MGIRFNKRIKLFPWLSANVGKSGVSLTIGPKGKTLNIGSTGVTVNVSMGKGVSYNKRLLSWKKLNLLSWLGIGGTAASKVAKSKTKTASKKGKKGTTASTELSLDDALTEVENQTDTSPMEVSTGQGGVVGQMQEQGGCSWGCAIFGCLGSLIIFALIVVIIYLMVRDGSIDFGSLISKQ